MSLQYPVADFLTRTRNALAVSHETVQMPSSNLKVAMAKILQQEGYIHGYSVTEGVKPELELTLKYYNDQPVIKKIRCKSRPGLREYRSCRDLPKILNGLGISIVSTSQGVMSDAQARKKGIGGEILCEVE